jgi:hydrogenase expression/formation protein HypC
MCLGIPGQIIAIEDPEQGLACVDSGGVQRLVDISCLLLTHPQETLAGRWVVVHVGFALALIDEAEALATLNLLAESQQSP